MSKIVSVNKSPEQLAADRIEFGRRQSESSNFRSIKEIEHKPMPFKQHGQNQKRLELALRTSNNIMQQLVEKKQDKAAVLQNPRGVPGAQQQRRGSRGSSSSPSMKKGGGPRPSIFSFTEREDDASGTNTESARELHDLSFNGTDDTPTGNRNDAGVRNAKATLSLSTPAISENTPLEMAATTEVDDNAADESGAAVVENASAMSPSFQSRLTTNRDGFQALQLDGQVRREVKPSLLVQRIARNVRDSAANNRQTWQAVTSTSASTSTSPAKAKGGSSTTTRDRMKQYDEKLRTSRDLIQEQMRRKAASRGSSKQVTILPAGAATTVVGGSSSSTAPGPGLTTTKQSSSSSRGPSAVASTDEETTLDSKIAKAATKMDAIREKTLTSEFEKLLQAGLERTKKVEALRRSKSATPPETVIKDELRKRLRDLDLETVHKLSFDIGIQRQYLQHVLLESPPKEPRARVPKEYEVLDQLEEAFSEGQYWWSVGEHVRQYSRQADKMDVLARLRVKQTEAFKRNLAEIADFKRSASAAALRVSESIKKDPDEKTGKGGSAGSTSTSGGIEDRASVLSDPTIPPSLLEYLLARKIADTGYSPGNKGKRNSTKNKGGSSYAGNSSSSTASETIGGNRMRRSSSTGGIVQAANRNPSVATLQLDDGTSQSPAMEAPSAAVIVAPSIQGALSRSSQSTGNKMAKSVSVDNLRLNIPPGAVKRDESRSRSPPPIKLSDAHPQSPSATNNFSAAAAGSKGTTSVLLVDLTAISPPTAKSSPAPGASKLAMLQKSASVGKIVSVDTVSTANQGIPRAMIVAALANTGVVDTPLDSGRGDLGKNGAAAGRPGAAAGSRRLAGLRLNSKTDANSVQQAGASPSRSVRIAAAVNHWTPKSKLFADVHKEELPTFTFSPTIRSRGQLFPDLRAELAKLSSSASGGSRAARAGGAAPVTAAAQNETQQIRTTDPADTIARARRLSLEEGAPQQSQALDRAVSLVPRLSGIRDTKNLDPPVDVGVAQYTTSPGAALGGSAKTFTYGTTSSKSSYTTPTPNSTYRGASRSKQKDASSESQMTAEIVMNEWSAGGGPQPGESSRESQMITNNNSTSTKRRRSAASPDSARKSAPVPEQLEGVELILTQSSASGTQKAIDGLLDKTLVQGLSPIPSAASGIEDGTGFALNGAAHELAARNSSARGPMLYYAEPSSGRGTRARSSASASLAALVEYAETGGGSSWDEDELHHLAQNRPFGASGRPIRRRTNRE